jgi:hypothetical protein
MRARGCTMLRRLRVPRHPEVAQGPRGLLLEARMTEAGAVPESE